MTGGVRRPDPFQIVKLPHLWSEDVDNNIPSIDEDPVCVGQAFHQNFLKPRLAKLLFDMICDGRHVSLRASGGYDHRVGDR